MGCILVSDTHTHSMDVFDDILLGTPDRSSNTAPKEVEKLEIDPYRPNRAVEGIIFIYCSRFLDP